MPVNGIENQQDRLITFGERENRFKNKIEMLTPTLKFLKSGKKSFASYLFGPVD